MNLDQLRREEAELDKLFLKQNRENLVDDEILERGPEEITLDVEDEVEEIEESTPVITLEEPLEENQPGHWKKRFTNYKAATDATISSLRKENASLTRKLSEALDSIDALSEKVATLVTVNDNSIDSLFTQEDEELVGEDAINIFKRATKEISEKATKPLKKELDELKKKEKEELRKRAEDEEYKLYVDEFLVPLSRLVPDYEELNLDSNFLKYLDGVDKDSGVQRLVLLRRAQSVHDAGRVASFFNEYKGSISKNPLNRKITPTGDGGGGTPNTPSKSKKTTFTWKEIEKHYNDHARGMYRGRGKDWKILEAQIDRAIALGNVEY